MTRKEFDSLQLHERLDIIFRSDLYSDCINEDYLICRYDDYIIDDNINEYLNYTSDSWRDIAATLNEIENMIDGPAEYLYQDFNYDAACEFHELTNEDLSIIVDEYQDMEEYAELFGNELDEDEFDGLEELIA